MCEICSKFRKQYKKLTKGSIKIELHKFYLRHHPFSTYAKCSENLIFLNSRYTHVRVRNKVRNLNFLKHFVYVLNGWSQVKNTTSFF